MYQPRLSTVSGLTHVGQQPYSTAGTVLPVCEPVAINMLDEGQYRSLTSSITGFNNGLGPFEHSCRQSAPQYGWLLLPLCDGNQHRAPLRSSLLHHHVPRLGVRLPEPHRSGKQVKSIHLTRGGGTSILDGATAVLWKLALVRAKRACRGLERKQSGQKGMAIGCY